LFFTAFKGTDMPGEESTWLEDSLDLFYGEFLLGMNGEYNIDKCTFVVYDEKSHPKVLDTLGDREIIGGWFEIFFGILVERGMIMDKNIALEASVEVVRGGHVISITHHFDRGYFPLFVDKPTEGHFLSVVLLDSRLDSGDDFRAEVVMSLVYHGL
jgi:hypothetical protein